MYFAELADILLENASSVEHSAGKGTHTSNKAVYCMQDMCFKVRFDLDGSRVPTRETKEERRDGAVFFCFL